MATEVKRGLGRGLDALLPSSRPAAAVAVAPVPQPGDGTREIALIDIDRHPYQTRLRVDELTLTQEQMAQRTGKDRASIANFLRLLKLPTDVQMEIDGGNLTFGHAKVLMALEAAESISKAAKQVIAQALSVRKTEELVYNLLHPVEKAKKQEKPQDPNVREAARMMQQSLGVRVEIDDHKGKGKIVLKYASLEDFDRIVEVLSK